MEKMKHLKFTRENLFNSETLQQYDEEGQKIFLSYMLYKGMILKLRKMKLYLLELYLKNKLKV